MSAKCDQCGVETEIAESFFKERKSFSEVVLTLCPTCRWKRQHAVHRWLFVSHFVFGALGALVVMLWPEEGIGWVFLNVFLFQMALTLTILPHELGHALVARWLGLRVFRLYVGSGRSWLTTRLLGFDVEFRSIPTAGLAVATHRNTHLIRLKHFLFVLAGPLANCLLAAAALLLVDITDLWTLQPFEDKLMPGLVFFYANLEILLVNLWPHNVTTPMGVFPSDGKQLWNTLFLTREFREQQLVATYVLEAAECHRRGEYPAAQSWVEKGLVEFPANETLLNWEGVLLIDLVEYGKARERFLKLLVIESKQPLHRPLMLNNIAYVNALLGDKALLDEADRYSQEAMAAMSWMPAIKGTRGTVLVALGRFDEGIPLLLESMSQADYANHKAQNACLIAEAEARRGNLVAARSYLEEARKLDPKCSLLKRAEAALR